MEHPSDKFPWYAIATLVSVGVLSYVEGVRSWPFQVRLLLQVLVIVSMVRIAQSYYVLIISRLSDVEIRERLASRRVFAPVMLQVSFVVTAAVLLGVVLAREHLVDGVTITGWIGLAIAVAFSGWYYYHLHESEWKRRLRSR